MLASYFTRPVMQWYYSKNSTQLGPVEEPELRAKLASGEVTVTDMVWREGMVDWVAVSTVPELMAVIRAGHAQGPAAASPYAPPIVPGAAPMPVTMGPPTSGLAIASLVCGILSLSTCMCMLFTGVLAIPAVICGHMALNRINAPGAQIGGRGMAIAGLITGYLSIGLSLVMAGFLVIGSVVESP